MDGVQLFARHLPSHLLTSMRDEAGASWPVAKIPEVIAACRVAGLISVGGDLQVHADGVWESPNFGVIVFAHELSDNPVEQAADVALLKFEGLEQGRMLAEVAAGRPGGLAGVEVSNLYFSWVARPA